MYSRSIKLYIGFFSSYVWTKLDMGYVQGMCDLLAPLLVIFDDGKFLLKNKPARLFTVVDGERCWRR